jgi:uncharacterized protein (DUF433 family)
MMVEITKTEGVVAGTRLAVWSIVVFVDVLSDEEVLEIFPP